jgi:RNA-directed DNA polymerase
MSKSVIEVDDVLKIQRGLARKAASEPHHRFDDLWRILYREDWLRTAQAQVLSNTGARTPGVDGITKDDLNTEEQRATQIARLREQLKSGAYRPQPVRRVHIPKPGKQETRPLGIPTIDDRIMQEAVRRLLEPIWESDFLDCSCGFRPGKRTWDAISELYNRIPNSQNRHRWIIEGDIRKCFDRVNHDKLLTLIEQRIQDQRIVKLIAGMLKAGVLEDGLFARTEEGTPQGGPLSPLLANIYLHELDRWIRRYGPGLTPKEKKCRRRNHEGNAVYQRYADDFVILWNGPKAKTEELREELRRFLQEELHLELSLEKTKITHATEGFDFLLPCAIYAPEEQ